MAEVGNGTKTHHASGTLERMGRATNALNGLQVGRRMLKRSNMHTNCLQMLLGLEAENFCCLLAEIAAHVRAGGRRRRKRNRLGNGRRENDRRDCIPWKYLLLLHRCDRRRAWIARQLTEEFAPHLDLDFIAQAHLQLLKRFRSLYARNALMQLLIGQQFLAHLFANLALQLRPRGQSSGTALKFQAQLLAQLSLDLLAQSRQVAPAIKRYTLAGT